jgi:hypothetical protein
VSSDALGLTNNKRQKTGPPNNPNTQLAPMNTARASRCASQLALTNTVTVNTLEGCYAALVVVRGLTEIVTEYFLDTLPSDHNPALNTANANLKPGDEFANLANLDEELHRRVTDGWPRSQDKWSFDHRYLHGALHRYLHSPPWMRPGAPGVIVPRKRVAAKETLLLTVSIPESATPAGCPRYDGVEYLLEFTQHLSTSPFKSAGRTLLRIVSPRIVHPMVDPVSGHIRTHYLAVFEEGGGLVDLDSLAEHFRMTLLDFECNGINCDLTGGLTSAGDLTGDWARDQLAAHTTNLRSIAFSGRTGVPSCALRHGCDTPVSSYEWRVGSQFPVRH